MPFRGPRSGVGQLGWGLSVAILFYFRAFLKANIDQTELVSPRLNLTANQLFWIGYAQDYCLWGDEFEYYTRLEDVILVSQVSIHLMSTRKKFFI